VPERRRHFDGAQRVVIRTGIIYTLQAAARTSELTNKSLPRRLFTIMQIMVKTFRDKSTGYLQQIGLETLR